MADPPSPRAAEGALTDVEIADLGNLLAWKTAGKWRFSDGELPRIIADGGLTIAGMHRIGLRSTPDGGEQAARINGRLVAAAVNALPRLLAQLAEAQRALDHFDMAVEMYTNDADLAKGMAAILRAALQAEASTTEPSDG
jgi:hypothetical protein